MMEKTKILLIVLLACLQPAEAQRLPFTQRYEHLGHMLHIRSAYAMFPHALRDSGHVYGGAHFPAPEHYRDSSVAIFVPNGFRRTSAVDLVFYFHGWTNNIDTAFAKYRIVEQFCESGKNAVLVHPEGPKNAPDSFGGKLEEPEVFKRLVGDVLQTLHAYEIIQGETPGRIILAGHSGAYRVMSFILLRGGLTDRIQEVYLFDALYGQTEKFAHWIDHSQGKFINIHTADGGTRQESLNLIDDLAAWGIPFHAAPESTITAHDLRIHRILFIDSELGHSDVIYKRDQLREYLRASFLSDR